ncbi:hypothetical protein EBU94_06990, partial [bacterium]|nr:hypothetical protein [bacterium]
VVEVWQQGANKNWTLKSRTLAKCTNKDAGLIEGYKPLLTSNMWTKLTEFVNKNLGGFKFVTFNPGLTDYQQKTLGQLEKDFKLLPGSIFGENLKDVTIYVKKVGGTKQGGTASIENLVKKFGLTLDEPNAGSAGLKYKFPLKDYQFELPDAAKTQQDVCVYPTSSMNSGLKGENGEVINLDAERMLNTTPDKKFCQASFDTLMSWRNGTTPSNPALAKLSAYKCVKTPDWKGRFDKGLFGKYEKIQNLITSSRDSWGIRGLLDSQGCQSTDVMAGETGQQQQTFRESENDSLKNLIRENLIKYSNLKKKDLSEETKIVKGRLNVLTEGRNFQNKSKREELFLEVIQESVYLQNQGFDENVISEGIFDMFSGLFGKTGGEGILQTFKEYLINWMVDKLTPLDSKGWLANIIVTTLSSVDIKDFPKLVSNCSFATARISEGVIEGMIKKLMSDKGIDNSLTGVIRNALFEGMKGTEFVKTIESGISSLICPGMSKISEKLSSKETSMAEKALSN